MEESAQAFAGGEALARAIARDAADAPVSEAWIGLLRRSDHAARAGHVLQWRHGPTGVETVLRPYRGQAEAQVAVLLVADESALGALAVDGFAAIPQQVRRGNLLPFVLMTQFEIEDAGLADFVEDLGLVFPKH